MNICIFLKICQGYSFLFSPCELQGSKNRAHSISWLEKSIPNLGVDCFVI